MNTPVRPAIESILVDIDSTLYDSDPLFAKYLQQLHGVSMGEIERWDFWRDHMTARDFAVLIRDHYHSPAEILAATPYPGAVEAVGSWYAAGAAIYVASDRNSRRTGGATRAWLAAIELPHTELVMRTPFDKVTYALESGIALIIDDKPGTLIQAVESGLAAATILHAYNRDAVAAHPEIIAAPDWPTLRRKVGRRLQVGSLKTRRRTIATSA